jgi:hypothetical protein
VVRGQGGMTERKARKRTAGRQHETGAIALVSQRIPASAHGASTGPLSATTLRARLALLRPRFDKTQAADAGRS